VSEPDDEQASSTTANGYRSHAYYIPSSLHERLKAAWWATRGEEFPDGSPSLSTKVAQLFADEASRLENKHNGGEPFSYAPKNARGVDPEASKRQGQFMSGIWSGRRDDRQ
jgi:hypothetical protein